MRGGHRGAADADGRPVNSNDPATYGQNLNHANEQATAGYYRDGMPNRVTATLRTGWQRYARVRLFTMTGDPVTPFLVDLWARGLLNGYESQVYSVLRKNATDAATRIYEFRAFG